MQPGVDALRIGVLRSAVHDPVAHGDYGAQCRTLVEPLDQPLDRRGMIAGVDDGNRAARVVHQHDLTGRDCGHPVEGNRGRQIRDRHRRRFLDRRAFAVDHLQN